MPIPRRIARLERVVLETIAVALQREVHDPRVGMVTVTRVQLASDLSVATVWWSSLGDEGERRTTARGLAAATRMLQSRVAQTMGTRVTPKLTLRYDEGLEKAQRLQGIFDKLREERGDAPAAPDADDPESAGDSEDAGGDDEADDDAAETDETKGDETEGETENDDGPRDGPPADADPAPRPPAR